MAFALNNTVKIFYEVSGEGPVLCICGGLGDSLRNWNLLTQKLNKSFTVLYVQNRGGGQSDRPQEPYAISDMAQDVLAVLKRENLTKVNLLGFSMGGRIAQELAFTNPNVIEKMVLVSTAATWQYRFPPKKNVRETLENFTGIDSDYVKIYEILYGPNYRNRFSPQSFVKFRKSDPHPQSLQDYRLQLDAIKNFDIRENLPQIEIPTLIMAGEQDSMTPVQNAQWLHSLLPQSKLKIYKDAGHIVQIEAPKEFLADLEDFLLN